MTAGTARGYYSLREDGKVAHEKQANGFVRR